MTAAALFGRFAVRVRVRWGELSIDAKRHPFMFGVGAGFVYGWKS